MAWTNGLQMRRQHAAAAARHHGPAARRRARAQRAARTPGSSPRRRPPPRLGPRAPCHLELRGPPPSVPGRGSEAGRSAATCRPTDPTTPAAIFTAAPTITALNRNDTKPWSSTGGAWRSSWGDVGHWAIHADGEGEGQEIAGARRIHAGENEAAAALQPVFMHAAVCEQQMHEGRRQRHCAVANAASPAMTLSPDVDARSSAMAPSDVIGPPRSPPALPIRRSGGAPRAAVPLRAWSRPSSAARVRGARRPRRTRPPAAPSRRRPKPRRGRRR